MLIRLFDYAAVVAIDMRMPPPFSLLMPLRHFR